jgi:hypothetical protein
MKKAPLLLLLPLLLPLCASPQIAAISRIESGGDHAAIGAAGERGAWQMSRLAWTHVNELRAARGVKVHPWTAAHTPAVARAYVTEYLAWLQGRFTDANGRPPTAGETYALWNLGYAGFQKRGFDLNRCPAITRRGAERMNKEDAKGAKKD